MESHNLLDIAVKVADTGPNDLDDDYYWISSSEILILRLSGRNGGILERAPFVVISQFLHTFELYLVDLNDVSERPLRRFNERFSRHLTATPMHVHCVDESGRDTRPPEIRYNAPRCGVASDGKWLLWEGRPGWRAARLDGMDAVSWQRDGNLPSHGFWLPNSHRWAALVSEWTDEQYVIPSLVIRRTNDPAYARKVAVKGLTDGLLVGPTNRDSFIMRHDHYG